MTKIQRAQIKKKDKHRRNINIISISYHINIISYHTFEWFVHGANDVFLINTWRQRQLLLQRNTIFTTNPKPWFFEGRDGQSMTEVKDMTEDPNTFIVIFWRKPYHHSDLVQTRILMPTMRNKLVFHTTNIYPWTEGMICTAKACESFYEFFAWKVTSIFPKYFRYMYILIVHTPGTHQRWSRILQS